MTRNSLQSQCLNLLLKGKHLNVDTELSDHLKLQGEFLLHLQHLEHSVLQALNEAKVHILDDDR